jgi:hypothetical protein
MRGLFNDVFFSCVSYIPPYGRTNAKDCEVGFGKWSLILLRYYPSICLEGPKTIFTLKYNNNSNNRKKRDVKMSKDDEK